MSGFPGPPSYSEVLAAQQRAEREAARGDAMHTPPERSPDLFDFTDSLRLRITLLQATKADLITTRELAKTVRSLENCLRHILKLQERAEALRRMLEGAQP